ncbi:MAG TPA: AcvB/VirJ family lysyl-phosphatidylglycerol hydrolase [Longimicrobium sp.]|nr:AcvB/VirJ family lysyl-phosphatidylglycerol hydrolase [Longimicrobium sp.]
MLLAAAGAAACHTVAVPNSPGMVNARPLRHLPLREMPTRGPGAVFAVVLTGDGLFPGLAEDIGRSLSRAGYPAVVWSSMRYYLHPRSPQQSADDLDRVIRWYGRQWERPGVVLVGYSMGADVLPFMVNRLPPDTRAAIRGLVLLGAADDAVFVFRVEEWWGPTSAPVLATLPEIQRLSITPVICAYGVGDDETACPRFADYLRVVRLGGGHHFTGEMERVTRLILSVAQHADDVQLAIGRGTGSPPAPASSQ